MKNEEEEWEEGVFNSQIHCKQKETCERESRKKRRKYKRKRDSDKKKGAFSSVSVVVSRIKG
jgi:hypothetical protein